MAYFEGLSNKPLYLDYEAFQLAQLLYDRVYCLKYKSAMGDTRCKRLDGTYTSSRKDKLSFAGRSLEAKRLVYSRAFSQYSE